MCEKVVAGKAVNATNLMKHLIRQSLYLTVLSTTVTVMTLSSVANTHYGYRNIAVVINSRHS